jgi:hypothetical protein
VQTVQFMSIRLEVVQLLCIRSASRMYITPDVAGKPPDLTPPWAVDALGTLVKDQLKIKYSFLQREWQAML